MNSEIVGLPTNMPWGFRFMNSDLPNPELPRHPAQLYEAICYLFSFFVLMYLYWRTNVKKKMGYLRRFFDPDLLCPLYYRVRQGSTGTLGSWNGLEYGTDFEYSFYSGGDFYALV